MKDTGFEELKNLLEEPIDEAVRRESLAFDEMSGRFGKSLVLFGAGGLGRKTLAGLARVNIRPIAFSDNNPNLWERQIDGIPIMSPAEAARRFGDTAAFVVTIWRAGGGHRFSHTREQLKRLGCSCIASFAHLFWKYPQIFLPYYCLDLPHKVISGRQEVLAAYELLAEEESRREYIAQLRFRLFLDFDGLPSPSKSAQYFPEDLFHLHSRETFIDCGAFDGDTLRAFLGRTNHLFQKIHAFEPDPVNFRKLQAFLPGLAPEVRSRIILHRTAAGEYTGQVGFSATGDASASAEATATDKVDCAPLDGILSAEAPTYVKLDIEGAEMDALKGAAGVIRQHQPVLAVSVYHQQDALWRIPLYLKTLFSGYQFFLRPHNEEGWDLVCYAIPEGRLAREKRERFP